MANIIFLDRDRKQKTVRLRDSVRIGSDAGRNQIVLPAEWGVAPEHVVMTRSAANKLPVLIDLTGSEVTVNRVPVLSLQVLGHGDQIGIGQARLTLAEVLKSVVEPGTTGVGCCVVCMDDLKPGEEIISCPRCSRPHHRECWLSVPRCGLVGCEYAIYDTVMDALSGKMTFDRGVEPSSKLLRERCSAGTPRDSISFQAGQLVAYC